jgi:predicted branched-subunit amino acid permease
MNSELTFQDFLTNQSVQVDLPSFALNIALAAFMAWVLGRVYLRFGDTLSNRQQFGRNFVLIAMTTVLIISVVKSSLALSLGLVGALSIVRFRAAIKEPE